MKIVIKPRQPIFRITAINPEEVLIINDEFMEDKLLRIGDSFPLGQVTGEITLKFPRWKLLFTKKIDITLS